MAIDKTVGEAEYRKVYQAFAETGDPAVIARVTEIDLRKVRHILQYGIIRLGLPPVREHAIRYPTVNVRLKEALAPYKDQHQDFVQSLPDLQEAVTKRAQREAAAAQATLSSAMHAADLCLGYVRAVMSRLQEEDGGYNVPAKVDMKVLSNLTKMVSNLTSAMDKALHASRLTAGEPTEHVSMQMALVFAGLSEEELRQYLKHQVLPARVRLLGSTNVGEDAEPLDSEGLIDAAYDDIEPPKEE